MGFRFLTGLSIGTSTTLNSGVIAETIPLEYRGKAVGAVKFFFVLGELIAIIGAWILFESLEKGNWRLLLFIIALICFNCFFIIALYYTGSARY